ncbi:MULTISPECIES: MFS transporter [Streptosporangium]|uniref:MFS family permease n=1 Tax=Streptosporangium brasiliense TaxID=47480 RepID=A0ABT9RE19_9ACTN|nr:MFS transporter [Streptosporangium brasiliense]MDP9866645.1 MFS family permease [Streptosporangium brasiliense]
MTVRRNERVLVGFTVATNLADGVAKVVLPLLAVGLTDSPGLVAGVGLTLTLPWLLASLHVGVLVDRGDRRRLAAAANLVRLVAVLGLLAAVAAGALSLPVLYLAGLSIGLAEVVASSAVGALVPAAVPRGRLGPVNAWIAGAETVANEFAGPAIGGLLAGVGAALALGSSAAAFALGAVLLALLVGRFRVSAPGEGDSGRPLRPGRVREEMVEGLAFLWRHRLLRTMSLTIAALVACWSAWLALLPSYAVRVLDLDPAGYGLLLGSIGVGGLLGAVLVTAVNRLLGVRWALFADLVGTIVMMTVPAVFPEAWAVGAAALLGGMGGTLWTVNSRTMAQMIVPDRLLGRYGAAARLLTWGTLPIGAGLAGLLAEIMGLTGTFAVFAGVAALPVIPFLMIVTESEIAVTQRRSELDHAILG